MMHVIVRIVNPNHYLEQMIGFVIVLLCVSSSVCSVSEPVSTRNVLRFWGSTAGWSRPSTSHRLNITESVMSGSITTSRMTALRLWKSTSETAACLKVVTLQLRIARLILLSCVSLCICYLVNVLTVPCNALHYDHLYWLFCVMSWFYFSPVAVTWPNY